MKSSMQMQYNVIPLHHKEDNKKARKAGLNKNRDGSVRKINGQVYVDFMYFNERVRESSGLKWNDKNAKDVREQLDRMIVAIKLGTFIFHKVFPHGKNRDRFLELEKQRRGEGRGPDEVFFKDYAPEWYATLLGGERVEGRTLGGYKSQMDNYLLPYFGDMTFSLFNAVLFNEFVGWARQLKLRKKKICNKTINKIFVPLKMICKDATIKYGWKTGFYPFFGFKKLSESDEKEHIFPVSLKEQAHLISCLYDHWKPYFSFAFRSGLRPGEQIGLKAGDINWDNGTLTVSRAITFDENGNVMEGKTKNKYSRRTIKLTEPMLDALRQQKAVHDKLKGEYFFCAEDGSRTDYSKLAKNVWLPSLKKAGMTARGMGQTRHSFATNALSHGESALWIAKIMGHRNANMIIKVYAKFIENARGIADGKSLTNAYRSMKGNQEET